MAGMQQPQPPYQHINGSDNGNKHIAHSHSQSHSQSHSHSLPNVPKPQQQQPLSVKPISSLPSSSSLSAPPPVPLHPLKQSSLSPSSRTNNRVSPSPSPPLPALPPPLPSKPPSRSRPSSASRSRPAKAEGETDDLTVSGQLLTPGLASEAIVTHVSPLSTARTSASKKLKTESSPPSLPPATHPSFVNGGMSLSHFPTDDDDADCSIITTTVVTATEREETRQHIHNNHVGGQREAVDDESEPGAAETEESGRRGTGLQLGLRLGGFEEAKEESEISTIPVFQEEQKEERRKPKLTLQHLSSHTSSSPHQLPRLPLTLPTSSSRPHTPQKGLHLHADDTATDGSADSIIITTTTTTTTTTTSTQMRLLPLAATPSSNSSSSAPFVPTKQSNMATTQSTSSRAAKLDFFLHDWYTYHYTHTTACHSITASTPMSVYSFV